MDSHRPPGARRLIVLASQGRLDQLRGTPGSWSWPWSGCESLEELGRSVRPDGERTTVLVEDGHVPPQEVCQWLARTRPEPEDLELALLVTGRDFERLRPLVVDPRCRRLFFVDGRGEEAMEELRAFLDSATAASLERPDPQLAGAREIRVRSYVQRGEALAALESCAGDAELGITTTTYIGLVADELLLNALFGTAVPDRTQRPEWLRGPWARQEISHEVSLGFARRGDAFVLRVQDSLGALTRPRVVEALHRSQLFNTEQVDASEGLGLVLTINLCRRLAVRVVPGQLCEIEASLPTRLRGPDAPGCLEVLRLIGL